MTSRPQCLLYHNIEGLVLVGVTEEHLFVSPNVMVAYLYCNGRLSESALSRAMLSINPCFVSWPFNSGACDKVISFKNTNTITKTRVPPNFD